MQIQRLGFREAAFVAAIALFAFNGVALADPPSRVGRLGFVTGAVSFSPAGENDWVQASLNRPLTTGDRLWAEPGAQSEIQVGGTMIRMNGGTSVSILNLDSRIVQLQLTQGTLNVRARRLDAQQVIEIDTPNLAFTLRQAGEFRISVDPDGNATDIVVRRGQGEAYGEGAAYAIDSRQPYRFSGTGLRDYQAFDMPGYDEFDRWSSDRDRRYDNSTSARYVSQDVVGYQDLDANGSWRPDPTYGNVWYPNRVAAGWTPYRDGHWAWIDPWGWTWIDDAPWGFAVSHYGRWTNVSGNWGWVPGPVRSQAYYAPALVAFVGGNNFQLSISGGNVGGVAWFPLGPRDVYRPTYQVSRGYFESVNRSNTVINTTVINNYYNNSNVTNVVYANRQVQGAVVAVPTTVFVQAQPVSGAAVRVSRDIASSAPVAVVPLAAPTERSVRGTAGAGGKPPARVFERPVVARTAPPAARAGFAAQQPQLAATPGKPLDDATRGQLKPAQAAAAPVVNVIAATSAAPPTVRPPPATRNAKPSDARREERTPSAVAAPSAALPPGAATAQPMPAAPSPKPQDQRGAPVARDRGNASPQGNAAVPPLMPQGAPTTAAAPPPVPASKPVAQPPEQRGRAEQRGRPETREQAAVLPAPPAPVAVQPNSVPPRAAPQPLPAQQAQRPEPARGLPPQARAPQQPAPRAEPMPAPSMKSAAPPTSAAPPAQPNAASKSEPAGQPPRSAATKANDKRNDREDAKREEAKREEDNRKPKE